MKNRNTSYLIGLAIVLSLVSNSINGVAQALPGAPLSLQNNNNVDTSVFKKSNTDEWHNETLTITYKHKGSNKTFTPDSSLHTFHRKPYSQPWYQDLGNFGTPMRNLQFTPENRLGPTLGYNVFNAYSVSQDSLKYYDASSPYSEFVFNLGSKLEQRVSILHTQNIRPNWNVAVKYNKITSQGYFLLHRSNHDNVSLSTNYQSVNRRYKLQTGIIHNRQQQDENGGLADILQLEQSQFNDRNTVDIAYSNATLSSSGNIPRSAVTNIIGDFSFNLEHSYAWGNNDTTYNKDSTKVDIDFTPRFSIGHKLLYQTKRRIFNDKAPDSLRYADFFNQAFVGDGSDSVFSRQQQRTFDNALLLNGFIGKGDKQLAFSAGAGVQLDKFTTKYILGEENQNIISNYIVGRISKEHVDTGQWYYSADARLYVTGQAAGNSKIRFVLGKDINRAFDLSAGVQQNISNAPYSYTTYYNQYDTIASSFKNETITKIFGSINSEKYGFNISVNNYLISNYIYLNSKQLPSQHTPSFNILQFTARKVLKWKGIVLDNEFLFQQIPNNAPVNVPRFMGRHQLSYERYIFKSALKIATGIEVRYQDNYYSAAYSPIFSRFYYQNAYLLSNEPQASVFFNFKIKRFRAYLMFDQVQQFFVTNMIVAPNYAASNAMLRFGFNWTLIK